jgi:hypothetical protein
LNDRALAALTKLQCPLCIVAGMIRFAKLQIAGPLALFVAVAGAEGAAWALAQSPTSEWLWFVNLKVFGLFQKSHYLVSESITLPYAQLLIALLLVAAALVGMALKNRLAVSLASNLSFFYVCATGFAAYQMEPLSPAASLNVQSFASSGAMVPTGPDACALLILLAVTLPSFVITHLVYFRAFRART